MSFEVWVKTIGSKKINQVDLCRESLSGRRNIEFKVQMHWRNSEKARVTIAKETNRKVGGDDVKGNWGSDYVKTLWVGRRPLEGFEQRSNMTWGMSSHDHFDWHIEIIRRRARVEVRVPFRKLMQQIRREVIAASTGIVAVKMWDVVAFFICFAGRGVMICWQTISEVWDKKEGRGLRVLAWA